MKGIYETEEPPKRAFLVGIGEDKTSKAEADSLAGELVSLCETLEMEITGQEIVWIRENHPKFGIGTGKAAELAEKAADLEADCLIFDREISPSQQRNWENLAGIPAVDRQELIIQIFAARAKTREAELQAALAELSYALPRLRHKYIDLARQRGGRYGSKGAGETRLETDRRLVEQRIHRLEQELAEVRKQRGLQRKKRKRLNIPACALVGYTNAGKSSLFNAMTGSGVLVEDKLFATLDASARRLVTGGGLPLVLIDTVGFIRRLPHTLIEAFRSTLEEAALADILIHVLDASDPDVHRCYETTLLVLRELEADKIPRIIAFNKADCPESRDILEVLLKRYPGGIPVSAKDGRGLPELTAAVEKLLSGGITRFRLPPDRHDLAALLYRGAQVLSEKYENAYIEIEARPEDRTLGLLKQYVVIE
jgi:GTP-binding protein HflX